MFHINNCCRVCMKDNLCLVNLYLPTLVDKSIIVLSDILVERMGLQVTKNDGLPENVCSDCAKFIQMIYTFHKQAVLAESEFKKIVSAQRSIKNELIKTELKSEEDIDDISNVDLMFDDFSKVENDYKSSYSDDGLRKIEIDETIDSNKYLNINKTETIQNENNTYTCADCDKQYSNRKKLLKHLRVHEKSRYYCETCKKSFRSKQSLHAHLDKDCSKKMFYCSVCNEEFDTESLLIDHIGTHSKSSVKCQKCDRTFNSSQSLTLHQKKYHQTDDDQDVRVLMKVKIFVCDICQKEMSSKSLLNRHMKLHTKEKPFKCTKCSKSYSRQDQLIGHMRWHDGVKPYICSFCSKGFIQLCSLKDHLRTHTGETPYLCSQCGKSFSNSSNLRQHMMRHTGVKPFACNLCPKSFATKETDWILEKDIGFFSYQNNGIPGGPRQRNLTRAKASQMTAHMTTHTGAHPYKCDECGGAFTKLNSLKKHKLIHLGIKPFACDTCNMRFSCKEHLKRHYRIHTGEKPYKCKYCERAFTQSNDLVKHMRMHVGQNIYQCTVCNMSFRLISELKQHYPTHYVNGDEVPKIPIRKGVEAPVLILKPQDPPPPPLVPDTNEIKDMDPRIRITINSNGLDKNGLAGDITINIEPEES